MNPVLSIILCALSITAIYSGFVLLWQCQSLRTRCSVRWRRAPLIAAVLLVVAGAVGTALTRSHLSSPSERIAPVPAATTPAPQS